MLDFGIVNNSAVANSIQILLLDKSDQNIEQPTSYLDNIPR